MALTFVDGFDSYAATSDLTKKWSAAGAGWTWGAAFGRNGGGGIQAIQGAGQVYMNAFTGTMVSNGVYLVFGCWVKISTTPGAISFLVIPQTAAGGNCGNIRVDTGGFVRLYNATGSLLITGTRNICDNIWHWIEWKFAFNTGAIAQTLYIDDVQEWTNNVALGSPIGDHLVFGSMSNATINVDDIIVYDNIGNSPLSGTDYPLGPREITTLRPTSDSAIQFTATGGTGTNQSAVNEVNADGDTSYVQDSVSGHQDLYGYADLSFTPSTINGVMLNGYIENPNSGSINFAQICKSNATQTDGTTTAAAASYRVQQQFFGVDPNTSAAWAAAGLNAALFGIKVP